jgi:deazaflavin-dependent oxidoreductase (nitroreductase family)
MSDWNRGVIEEFRANEGRVRAFARQPLLLLRHTGSKTGIRRTNPLASFRDGDRYVVVASKGGAPANPDWYRNLLANPRH